MAISPTAQLEEEIENVVRRYSQESDLEVAQLVGVLEIIKARWTEALIRNRKEFPDD